MIMELRIMTPEEQKYAFSKSQQLMMQCGGILKDRNAMNFYCANQPGSRMESRYNGNSFGFRAGTENYAYLIRCNPQKGDYNFYVFPYIAKWLDRNIEQACKGIRFIDSHYHELFRIPDGGNITVTYENGETDTRSCRYIDEAHVEVGSNLYHICEFAERMEQNGYTYAPAQTADDDKGKPIKSAKKKDYER